MENGNYYSASGLSREARARLQRVHSAKVVLKYVLPLTFFKYISWLKA